MACASATRAYNKSFEGYSSESHIFPLLEGEQPAELLPVALHEVEGALGGVGAVGHALAVRHSGRKI